MDLSIVSSPRPSRALSLAAVAVLLLAGACRAPAREVDPDPVPGRDVPTAGGEPGWIRQPLTWEKLEALEAWLQWDAQHHEPGLVIEARLQLSEGRLEFSRRDLEAGNAPGQALRVRIESARLGFLQVVDDSLASTGQQTRARIGIDAADALLDVPDPGGLRMVSREDWRARPARTDQMTELRGQWSRITLHHSAESAHESLGGSLGETVATVRRIQKVHMDRTDPDHGWADIGYHFLVDSSGRILQGRELEWQGAHAGGANNRQNLGVCLLGDFSVQGPSPAAIKSLELLLADLRRNYRIPASRIYAHKDLGPTVCPGEPISAWLSRYKGAQRGRN